MRRDFLKTAALASAGMMGGVTGAMAQQQPAATGLRGNASDTYVMNVMVSGVEYWFPVYEMMKQLGRTLGVKTRYSGTPEYDVNKQLASFEQELARNQVLMTVVGGQVVWRKEHASGLDPKGLSRAALAP